MPTTTHRIATVVTPELEDAVEAAPQAEIVEPRASEAERLRAWALYGYRHWQAERAHEEKLEAYRRIAADEERRAAIREANLRAAEAGLL
jgi:hypothetical protein